MSQGNGINAKGGSDGAAQRTRRHFTAEEKATILRRHLSDKVAVSALCDEYRIQPTLFYLWQRQALENLGAALQDGRTPVLTRHRRNSDSRSRREKQAYTGRDPYSRSTNNERAALAICFYALGCSLDATPNQLSDASPPHSHGELEGHTTWAPGKTARAAQMADGKQIDKG